MPNIAMGRNDLPERHIDFAQLFATEEYTEFSFSKRHDYFLGNGRPIMGEQYSIIESQLTRTAIKLVISIPFIGNSKWFAIFRRDTPFSPAGISESPTYSVVHDQHNERYLEVRVTALPERFPQPDAGKNCANELVSAINEYILVLCGPPCPPLGQLLESLKSKG